MPQKSGATFRKASLAVEPDAGMQTLAALLLRSPHLVGTASANV
jgi:hypothetical protein